MKYRFITMAVVFVMIVAAFTIHIQNSSVAQELVDGKQLEIYLNDELYRVITYDEILFSPQEVSATMQRQVGEPTTHLYTGVALSNLMEYIGIDSTEFSMVSVTSIDQYTVTLTVEEMLQPKNVFLVFEEDGEPLSDDTGSYMLVILNDEFSTRWNKSVVSFSLS